MMGVMISSALSGRYFTDWHSSINVTQVMIEEILPRASLPPIIRLFLESLGIDLILLIYLFSYLFFKTFTNLWPFDFWDSTSMADGALPQLCTCPYSSSDPFPTFPSVKIFIIILCVKWFQKPFLTRPNDLSSTFSSCTNIVSHFFFHLLHSRFAFILWRISYFIQYHSFKVSNDSGLGWCRKGHRDHLLDGTASTSKAQVLFSLFFST